MVGDWGEVLRHIKQQLPSEAIDVGKLEYLRGINVVVSSAGYVYHSTRVGT